METLLPWQEELLAQLMNYPATPAWEALDNMSLDELVEEYAIVKRATEQATSQLTNLRRTLAAHEPRTADYAARLKEVMEALAVAVAARSTNDESGVQK
jgi:hypothetical protein